MKKHGTNKRKEDTTMMKFMTNIKTLAALLMAGTAFAACSSSDDANEQPVNITKPQVYTLVIKASKGDATTRALRLDGKTLNAYWSGEETIEVYQSGEKIGTATAAPSADGNTTVTATLTSAPVPSNDLNFYLGGYNNVYTGQNGLLTGTNSISEKYDYAESLIYSGAYTVDGYNVIPGEYTTLNFTDGITKQAIIKFTLKDKGNSDVAISPSALNVSDGTSTVSLTSIPAATYSTNGAGVLYVAFPATGSPETISLTATAGGKTYGYKKSDATFTNGKYYEITVKMEELKFTVASGTKVNFSKGNLQATYNGSTWSWGFAEHQWDYIGNAEGNTKVTNTTPFVSGYSGYSTTVDLFGWVGESSSWDGAAQYGITSNTESFLSIVDGYGKNANENLMSDWGNTIVDGNTWRTLTSDEWNHLFTGRTDAAQKYGHGSIDGVKGIVILPDIWVLPTGLSFTAGNSAWTNSYTTEQWTQMEAAGAVFLPAAGYRNGTTVTSVFNDKPIGSYWSSSSYSSNNTDAYYVTFSSGSLSQAYHYRYYGGSVRLVR